MTFISIPIAGRGLGLYLSRFRFIEWDIILVSIHSLFKGLIQHLNVQMLQAQLFFIFGTPARTCVDSYRIHFLYSKPGS
jgi:hypothetical protein